MPNGPSDTLPEGTDTVLAGASADTGATASAGDFKPAIPLDDNDRGNGADDGATGGSDGLRARASSAAQAIKDQASERTADLRGQAGDKARAFAEQGKERATAALDNVSRLIGDAADQVDDKVGGEYGDYARRAAGAVEDLANTLRDRDVDQLVDDARELVRRSPAIAIGAAAVLGFALVRLVKAGAGAETAQAAPDDTAPRAGGAKGRSGPKSGGRGTNASGTKA